VGGGETRTVDGVALFGVDDDDLVATCDAGFAVVEAFAAGVLVGAGPEVDVVYLAGGPVCGCWVDGVRWLDCLDGERMVRTAFLAVVFVAEVFLEIGQVDYATSREVVVFGRGGEAYGVYKGTSA